MHLGGAFSEEPPFSVFFSPPQNKKPGFLTHPKKTVSPTTIRMRVFMSHGLTSGLFSFHTVAPGCCLLVKGARARNHPAIIRGNDGPSGHDGWYVSEERSLASGTLVVSISNSKVIGLWGQRIYRDGGVCSHQCMWKGQWMEIFIASIGRFWKFALDMKLFLFKKCMGISSSDTVVIWCMNIIYMYMWHIVQVLLCCLLLAPIFIDHFPWNSLGMEVFSWSKMISYTTWPIIQHQQV